MPRGASGPLEGAEFLGRVAGQTSKHASMPLLLALLLYGGFVSLPGHGPQLSNWSAKFEFPNILATMFKLGYLDVVFCLRNLSRAAPNLKRRTVNNSNRRV